MVTVAEGGAPGKTWLTALPKAPNVPGAASAKVPNSSNESSNKNTAASANICQRLRRTAPAAALPVPALPLPGGIPPAFTLGAAIPAPAPIAAAPATGDLPELRRNVGIGTGTTAGLASSSGSGSAGG